MGNCCAGEERQAENRAVLSPAGSKMKIASKEFNLDSFGAQVSSFFELNEDQKAALAKHQLPRLVAKERIPISQAAGGQAKFEGQLIGTQKEGVGHLLTDDGDFVVCTFSRDQANGEGAIFYKNGDCYKGAIVNGLPEGQGVMVNKDGRRYEGAFKAGLKNGYGVFTWADGSKYEGQWLRVQHGKGKYTDAKGRTTEGEFYEGKKLK